MRLWPFGRSGSGSDGSGGSGEAAQALVYRGPAAMPGCAESVARVLQQVGLSVDFVGPKERLPLTAQSLSGRLLYAQPGGPDLDDAWHHIAPAADAIRDFVAGGGYYAGFCLGGYLAGRDPGLRMLPGDTDQYIGTRGASVDHDRDALVTVTWSGSPRELYFQDGPYFALKKKAVGTPVRDGGRAQVVAEYDNGLPAAVLCRYGDGVIAAVGPHPEATDDWFTDSGLPVPRPLGIDLAEDLLRRLLDCPTGANAS